MLGEKLKLARKKMGFSLDRLVDEIGGVVSKQSLSKYERNQMVPNSEVLLLLSKALDTKVASLLSNRVTELTEIDYRKRKSTSAKDKARVEASVFDYMERYLMVEDVLGLRGAIWEKPDLSTPLNDIKDVEQLADDLRDKWKLGNDPIPDMTALLEEHGVKVLMFELPNSVSGLTCFVTSSSYDKSFPIVIVNSTHSLERRRSTLAHELAHRLFDGNYNGDDEEKAAQRFAGCFLMQRDHLIKYAGDIRAKIAYDEIVRLKHIYRVSASSIIVRLEQIDVISQSVVSTIFQTIGRRWRSSEPKEIEEKRNTMEQPERFRRITLFALAEKYISIAKAMELLQETPKEIERALNGPDFNSSK